MKSLKQILPVGLCAVGIFCLMLNNLRADANSDLQLKNPTQADQSKFAAPATSMKLMKNPENSQAKTSTLSNAQLKIMA